MALSTMRATSRLGARLSPQIMNVKKSPMVALSHFVNHRQFSNVSQTGTSTTPFAQVESVRYHKKSEDNIAAEEQIQHTDRAQYKSTAHNDFVKDYRELAKMPVWNEILAKPREEFHALDVCCGTGRWAHAFSDLVCKPRGLTILEDFVDLCGNSLDVLQARAQEMKSIKMGRVHRHDLGRRGAHTLNPSSYDLAVNMHGLYGVPPKLLPAAMTFMQNMLREGGRLIIALGSEDSLYQKIPTELQAKGILDQRFTSVPQVLEACKSLGLEVETESLLYYEEFNADDTASVTRFVMDECVGNTFDVDGTPKFSEGQLWDALRPLVDQYLDKADNKYKFRQDISIITLHKKFLVPDMLSCDSFYDDAYALRRRSSTMQSSMLDFLKTEGQDVVWAKLPAATNKRLSMLAIGCGDGEMDFALLDSFKKADGLDGIDILALEPSTQLRDTFAKDLPKQKWYGGGDVSISLQSAVFDPASKYAGQNGQLHDLVMIAHVLYYFDDKVEALRGVLQQVKPGGSVVVIHQSHQGVPEIQEKVMPKLRGHSKDMFTSTDIAQILTRELSDDVASFTNYEISAYMNTKEVLQGSENGMKIMSFAIEADMRAASKEQIAEVQNEFKQKSLPGPVRGHSGEGPFMYEPVHCFVIRRA